MKKLLSVLMAFVIVMSSALTIETMTDISVISKTASAASYTTGVYRVNHSNGVNVRRGAGTSYARVGAASKGVEFTVTQIKTAGGYTWGYTSSIKCTNGTRSGWLTLNNCKFIRSTSAAVVTVAPTISFSGMKFTTAFQEGMSKSISGTISSTSAIDSIRADVINSSGTTVLTKTVYPNTRSYSLAYSTLDYGLKFGSLPSDTYRLCYTVKSGSTTQYYNHSFVVVAVAPTITFSDMYFPSGIKYGNSQNIKGTISSTQNITNITATVTTSTGSTVLSKSDTPYTKSYTLKNSPLDYGLKFGSLAVGRYRLTYTVTSGSTTKTYTHSFAVEALRDNNTSSGSVVIVTPSNTSNKIDAMMAQAKADVGNFNGREKYKEAWCAHYVSRLLIDYGGYNITKAANVTLLTANIVNSGQAKLYLYSDTHYNAVYNSATKNKSYAYTSSGAKFNAIGLNNTKLVSKSDIVPQNGDIILFNWTDDVRGTFSHVGVVQYTSSGSVYTIEGNTTYFGKYSSSNLVHSGTRPYNYSNIVGIIRMS